MSLSDFEFLSKLGEGAYSTVFKVRRISDNTLYALKKVRMNKLKEKEKSNALNEVRILASINHPNIISYKEAFFDEGGSLCLVMEYADEGDLYHRILSYQKKGCYMSESFIWKLLTQLVKGLKALHDLQILHRDLKSANVFLTSSGGVKLGDMNVSKVAKQGFLHTQTGTPYYASPEVWKDTPYNIKSDIWSLVCVIYEAASLKPPFRADDMKGLYKKVVKGEYPKMPKSFSPDLQAIVSSLIEVDSRTRPTCADLLKMPSVIKHIAPENSEDTSNSLLGTIKMNRSRWFAGSLPKPNYEDFSYNEKKGSRRVKHVSESPGIKSRRQILKDNYGALQLPRIKYPVSSIRLGKVNPHERLLQKCLPISEKKIVPRIHINKSYGNI